MGYYMRKPVMNTYHTYLYQVCLQLSYRIMDRVSCANIGNTITLS